MSISVSRTPLCMYFYLVTKGIKAINTSLVAKVPLTVGLYNIHGNKIIGLTINPFDLSEIGKNRVGKFKGLNSNF